MEIRKGQTINFPVHKKESQVRTSLVRAVSSKIETTAENFSQYARTIKAFAQARMPFRMITNTAHFLGDKVENMEIDAPVQTGWQNKVGEVVEGENRILAWQDRGEHIEVTHQLPASGNSNKVINLSDYLPEQIGPKQEIPTLEGINVYKDQAANNEFANNPYLQAPADLKKAA